MKTKFIKNIIFSGVIAMLAVSCTKDLDQEPRYEVTSASVYKDFSNYKLVLAKAYSGFALTGSKGPTGDQDILGGDEGFSSYLRQYWQLQELSTDEAVIGWNDAGLADLHNMDWNSSNQFVTTLYYRIFYQIGICNEFIRETTDKKLSSRGITGDNLAKAKVYRAEARFLRALSYWHALDLFGNVPFVTENNKVGAFFPNQINKSDLFNYIEAELKAIEPELLEPRKNEYGRADQAAAWMVLAKLYLNAEVYIGQSKYTEAISYANKVITSGYAITTQPYANLFLTDNNKSREIIFAITFDGLRTQTYGGMVYLVHGPIPNDLGSDYGIDGGWGGMRATKSFVNLFPGINAPDKRAMFYTTGHTLEIDKISEYSQGYPLIKYKNVSSTGSPGSHKVFVDTDFPMFRLGDAYLMYAEAVLRGGSGGDKGKALEYVNAIRERAFGNTSGNIIELQLTLDYILDERARELSWEGHRRTDLIRFGKFTEATYLWPWKGGVKDGKGVESFRKLYPIPSPDVIANPNLKQNDGY